MTEKEKYIRCLGVDNKWHVCKPDADKCKCGVKVKTKKIDKMENKHFYSCYECTY